MPAAKLTKNQLVAVICLVLAIVTLAVYWPVTGDAFINLDDEQYITANPHVQAGLAWPSVVWAFKSTDAANWHPLTWISHMVDWQLFGNNPAGHHLMSVGFHIANVLLLFIFLNWTTGALWRSAFAAAFFAWHPLRVESVAWAAERKDVLSAFFWMLTLLAYAGYVEKSKVQSPKSKVFYVLALFLFVCGLLSKPMVVTLPFVLLLLDFWPLKRISNFRFQISDFSRLIVEKIPFFALTIVGSLVTYFVQKSAGATWSESSLPFSIRAANALVSCLRYLSKTFWPSDLAVIYPFQQHQPVLLIAGAALLLAICSTLCVLRARQNPYLATGWFWFLGTLVPVIGLVQVGAASMADRYTYLPSIGLFIAVVWGASDLVGRWPEWKKLLPVAGGIALAGCLAVTSVQLIYWRNSAALFTHTIAVTPGNYSACNFLGRALDDAGQRAQAIYFYTQSVEIAPDYPEAQFNLGMDLWHEKNLPAACEHLASAVNLVPENAEAHYYLGAALMQNNEPDKAAAQFTEALRLKPDFSQARRLLDEISSNVPANRSTP
ncbi:MAG TPA: tetratricopeptide repeat protein [Verrucomicrobiae bacterium]|nr:tetratricopeptide repeat protein [Verrucomicrobiae bacterium]